MNGNSVVKLNFVGPQGQELFLVVDFTQRQAALLVVEPTTGNIRVTDTQDITRRGV